MKEAELGETTLMKYHRDKFGRCLYQEFPLNWNFHRVCVHFMSNADGDTASQFVVSLANCLKNSRTSTQIGKQENVAH